MNRNKVCPNCRTEYLLHIEKCADCGAVLLANEDFEKANEEKMRLAQMAIENEVAIREGDLNWLSELYTVLIDAGIPCNIRSDPGCKKGCQDKNRLVVTPDDVERAQERIEEYFMEMHPEIRASRELASQGKCPACGSPVGAEDRECPDCGLPLIIGDDEEGGKQEH